MSPLVRAMKLRASEGADFCAELQAHLSTGVVISTPRIFMMGRPCPRGADMSDLMQKWPLSKCDAWFVWCAVGELRELVAAMPFSLPWIGWHRQGRGWERNHWVSTVALNAPKIAQFSAIAAFPSDTSRKQAVFREGEFTNAKSLQ